MLVKERMSTHPITITPDTSLFDALRVMREQKVRRLPILTKKGKLVGIILEKDLLYASPSPASSLSVYEMNYLIAKISVEDLMTRDVITVEEDTPLEEAARIMVDNSISGLPVMRGEQLVGMITESDLFKIFMELLGARSWGLRVTIKVPNIKGILADLTTALAEKDGFIVSLGTFWADDPTVGELTFRVQNITEQTMRDIVEDLEATIVDIREVTM